jgi:hypothetical protein
MAIQAPPLTSNGPAQKTISFPGALAEDIVQSFRAIRVAVAGDVKYQCALDGSVDTLHAVQAGETLEVAGLRVYAAGTTAQGVTIHL